MHKKVLNELDFYYGDVKMPKGFEIDRISLAIDIFKSEICGMDLNFSRPSSVNSGERLLEKNILSKTAAEKDPILEGLQKGILDPIVENIPGLASGGSVAAALQRAEARTRHVQRGR